MVLQESNVRGYFGIGVEEISKPLNVGNLFRSAHAFGASFAFTVNAHEFVKRAKSDTSRGWTHMPWYEFDSVQQMTLPTGCTLVGVELIDDAVDLPSFKHPQQAAYVLGREKGSLSPEMLALCSYVIKIPTRFCVNVAMAGAIVMYDRTISLGNFAERPVVTGGPRPEEVGTPDSWQPPQNRNPR